MISLSFYFLLALAVFTAIWQTVVGPALRTCLRYRLFAVRDMIHREAIENPRTPDIARLEDIVNGSIFLVHRIDVVGWSKMRRLVEESSISDAPKRWRHPLRRTPFSENVVIECCRVVHWAAGVNSCLALLGVLPLCLPLMFVSKCRSWYSNYVESVNQLVESGESGLVNSRRAYL